MEDLLFDFISKYIILTQEEKEALISLNIFHTVPKGTVLLREGEISNKGYFVLKGCLRVYYVVDGEEKTTAFYTEMEGLTPNCVTTKSPSLYYIVTSEDSILTIGTPEMETEIFEKFPKFEKLCRILSEEVLFQQKIDFDEFKIQNAEERYLNLIEKRPDLVQRVPQHQLASFIGVKPQSLSRLKARVLKNNN